MHSITSLAAKLRANFPHFYFVASSEFRWAPGEKTIYYDQGSEDLATLLHELSHAILHHETYKKDVELIELERDAWKYAEQNLARQYSVDILEDTIQESLDTYRDWLHARSMCPNCQATGVQMSKNSYKCIVCITTWRVNDARSCALRRHRTN